ncbi:MAG: ATP-binding protein [Patulibacter sp.]
MIIREAEHDTLDDTPVERVTLADLEADSIAAYRQELANEHAEHPFLKGDNELLLRSIGALVVSPESGHLVASRAGVLMFGNWHTLRPNFPRYDVDYHLVVDDDPKVRWTQRITTDGTWSGNLYDFYRRASNAITKELRVPFRLRGDQRVGEGPEQAALREALVNTLIHADHDSSTHIVVRQTSDEIMFRNGGTLRLPVEVAMAGGRSDCRNLNLQKMFQLVGYGEKLGSGFPLIRTAWQEKGWAQPRLEDQVELDSVELRLRFGPEVDKPSLSTGQAGEHGGQAGEQAPLSARAIEVIKLCAADYATTAQLRERLAIQSRSYVARQLVQPLMARGYLELRFPDQPRHPEQAYRATPAGRAAVQDEPRP